MLNFSLFLILNQIQVISKQQSVTYFIHISEFNSDTENVIAIKFVYITCY